jgi:hypothetical protein
MIALLKDQLRFDVFVAFLNDRRSGYIRSVTSDSDFASV